MSNSKNKRKRRAWPEKRRLLQAENCRRTKPWLHTTGPKTPAGKAAVAENAYQHGFRGREMDEIRRLLRAQRLFVRALLAAPLDLQRGIKYSKNHPCKPVIARNEVTKQSSTKPAVYITASKRNGTLYTGVTSNLPKRAYEHKNSVIPGFASNTASPASAFASARLLAMTAG